MPHSLLNRRSMLAAGVAALPWMAQAQPKGAWPERPITLVVPYPPGGTTDVNARLVAQVLSKSLGQPIVIENRPGANGNIGSASVAKAKPDGYTLVASNVGTHAANVGLYANMPYDPLKDFTHITSICASANAIAVHPDFPARTFSELLDTLKSNPDKYNYASPGTGSSGHLAFELLKSQGKLSAAHIPYKGAAPALTDVMGGQVPILVIVADTLGPHVKAGKLRVLAVTSEQRSPLFPDVPTVAESGFAGFRAVSWMGLSGPAGLPSAITDRLYKETAIALRDPSVAQRMKDAGNIPGGLTPQAYTEFVKREALQWTTVAKAANLRAE